MFRLCLVTAIGDKPLPDYLQFLEAVIKGGVDLVQWREKNNPFEKIDEVHAIKKTLDNLGVPLLINDHPSICKMIDASGVHLGNNDMAVASARDIIGHEKTIGLSIESEGDLRYAYANSSINYVTASAIFASQHKDDTKKIWGLDGLENLIKQREKTAINVAKQKNTKPQTESQTNPQIKSEIKPQEKLMTAIGGITLDNVAAVMACGVYGVAVVGALHDAKTLADATSIAKDFRKIIDSHQSHED